jgi:hypothetical protein
VLTAAHCLFGDEHRRVAASRLRFLAGAIRIRAFCVTDQADGFMFSVDAPAADFVFRLLFAVRCSAAGGDDGDEYEYRLENRSEDRRRNCCSDFHAGPTKQPSGQIEGACVPRPENCVCPKFGCESPNFGQHIRFSDVNRRGRAPRSRKP